MMTRPLINYVLLFRVYNGKAAARLVSALTIRAKISLHVLGSGGTCYSNVWRNNIKFIVLKQVALFLRSIQHPF